MKISFSKYQGAGNDFVMLDNRDGRYTDLTIQQIQTICDRKFGIGADGLIKINAHPTLDFQADYFNADGSKSFCGNGGRCAVSFAKKLDFIPNAVTFLGYDGPHKAIIDVDKIHLEMINVDQLLKIGSDYELYTGSPHYIHFLSDVATFDIFNYGQSIRYNDTYRNEGINVNAVEIIDTNHLHVRTYERGVEDETLACGTGVTASAIAYAHKENKVGHSNIKVKVQGGDLAVQFHYDGKTFSDVWLIGPGTFVFEGTIDV